MDLIQEGDFPNDSRSTVGRVAGQVAGQAVGQMGGAAAETRDAGDIGGVDKCNARLVFIGIHWYLLVLVYSTTFDSIHQHLFVPNDIYICT